AAAPDEFDDFKLGKLSRQFLDGRRRETRILPPGSGSRGQRHFHQTSRAQTARGVGGQGSPAILAKLLCIHIGSFHPLLKESPAPVTNYSLDGALNIHFAARLSICQHLKKMA